ncbi:MAG: ribosome-binding factor A [Dehalococcoidia bacterium]|nr:ribosome-binding factor A [Dehalococcoidia bacterium]
MKIRSKRIAASIANQVSQVISSGLNDPRVSSLITINHVQLTPDLRTATIFISTLGDKESQLSTLNALRSANGYIRRELSTRLELRHIPEITFKVMPSMPQDNLVISILDSNL